MDYRQAPLPSPLKHIPSRTAGHASGSAVAAMIAQAPGQRVARRPYAHACMHKRSQTLKMAALCCGRSCSWRSRRLLVYEARAVLLVLGLAHPHLLERAQAAEDGAACSTTPPHHITSHRVAPHRDKSHHTVPCTHAID